MTTLASRVVNELHASSSPERVIDMGDDPLPLSPDEAVENDTFPVGIESA